MNFFTGAVLHNAGVFSKPVGVRLQVPQSPHFLLRGQCSGIPVSLLRLLSQSICQETEEGVILFRLLRPSAPILVPVKLSQVRNPYICNLRNIFSLHRTMKIMLSPYTISEMTEI